MLKPAGKTGLLAADKASRPCRPRARAANYPAAGAAYTAREVSVGINGTMKRGLFFCIIYILLEVHGSTQSAN